LVEISSRVLERLQCFCSLTIEESFKGDELPLKSTDTFLNSWSTLWGNIQALAGSSKIEDIIFAITQQKYNYMKINLPPPETRKYSAVLSGTKSRPHSRINNLLDASRIRIYGKNYIAFAQPRRLGECPRLWDMLLGEGVEIVIQLNEEPQLEYWRADYIEVLESTHHVPNPRAIEHITAQKLKITRKGKTYIVWHLHYRCWADVLGVSDLSVFKYFLDMVKDLRHKSSNSSAPIAVHCRAGWGRTGVFMMVDSLRDKLLQSNHHQNIISKTWRKLLLQRESVQNPLQLAFVSGYLHTKETFTPEAQEELYQIIDNWLRILYYDSFNKPEIATYSSMVKELYETGNDIWERVQNLNPDMVNRPRKLFFLIVSMPDQCSWLDTRGISFKVLMNTPPDSFKRTGLHFLGTKQYRVIEGLLQLNKQ